jgi:hypothetical protein
MNKYKWLMDSEMYKTLCKDDLNIESIGFLATLDNLNIYDEENIYNILLAYSYWGPHKTPMELINFFYLNDVKQFKTIIDNFDEYFIERFTSLYNITEDKIKVLTRYDDINIAKFLIIHKLHLELLSSYYAFYNNYNCLRILFECNIPYNKFTLFNALKYENYQCLDIIFEFDKSLFNLDNISTYILNIKMFRYMLDKEIIKEYKFLFDPIYLKEKYNIENISNIYDFINLVNLGIEYKFKYILGIYIIVLNNYEPPNTLHGQIGYNFPYLSSINIEWNSLNSKNKIYVNEYTSNFPHIIINNIFYNSNNNIKYELVLFDGNLVLLHNFVIQK